MFFAELIKGAEKKYLQYSPVSTFVLKIHALMSACGFNIVALSLLEINVNYFASATDIILGTAFRHLFHYYDFTE